MFIRNLSVFLVVLSILSSSLHATVVSLSLAETEVAELIQGDYIESSIIDIDILDPPADSQPGSTGLVFNESNSISVDNLYDNGTWYYMARPRAGLDKKSFDIYNYSSVLSQYQLVSYEDIDVNFSSSEIQPAVSVDDIPEGGKVLSRMVFGHFDGSSSWPQVFDISAAGYVRFNGYSQEVGSSLRLAAHNAFDDNEDFPRITTSYSTIIDDGNANLTCVIDSEGFAGISDMTMTPGETSKININSSFTARRDIIASQEPNTGFISYSSMYWKGTDETTGNDQAHDLDYFVVGYDTNENGKPDTIYEYKVSNPTKYTEMDFSIYEPAGSTIVYVALEQRELDESKYSAYDSAKYHERSSYSIQVNSSSIPVTAKLLVDPSDSEYFDNVVALIGIKQDIDISDEIEIDYDTYAYAYLDSDNDGLSDNLEDMTGILSSSLADTDGDGTNDYQEMLDGTINDNSSSSYSGGSGTLQDPYLISSVNELSNISLSNYDKYFKLINNLNLKDYYFTSSIIASEEPFTGSFNGDGYTIYNMTIDATTDNVGLFGSLDGAAISSLTIREAEILGQSNVGTLAGSCENSSVNDCMQFWSIVNGQENSGGLVGYSYNSTFDSCDAYCNFVTSNGPNLGGFCGQALGGSIYNCSSSGEVIGIRGKSASDHNGTTGPNYAGGFIGFSDSAIDSCSSKAKVIIPRSILSAYHYDYSGTFAGQNRDSISNSYSIGYVKGNYKTGGFVGENEGGFDGSIEKCFTCSSVSSKDKARGSFTASNWSDGTIEDCYWDNKLCKYKSDGGTGLTTSEMKSSIFYQSWESPNWIILDGSYPMLSYEEVSIDNYDTADSYFAIETFKVKNGKKTDNLNLKASNIAIDVPDEVSIVPVRIDFFDDEGDKIVSTVNILERKGNNFRSKLKNNKVIINNVKNTLTMKLKGDLKELDSEATIIISLPGNLLASND